MYIRELGGSSGPNIIIFIYLLLLLFLGNENTSISQESITSVEGGSYEEERTNGLSLSEWQRDIAAVANLNYELLFTRISFLRARSLLLGS